MKFMIILSFIVLFILIVTLKYLEWFLSEDRKAIDREIEEGDKESKEFNGEDLYNYPTIQK